MSKGRYRALLPNRVAALAVILFSFIFALVAHSRAVGLFDGSETQETIDYRLGNPVAIYGNAGFGGFLASCVWVRSVFEYASVIFDNESSVKLPSYLSLSCDLDTNWVYSRLFGSYMLVELKGVDPSIPLAFLEDGIRRIPSNWQLRVTYAAFLLEAPWMDSTAARDSAAKILLPLSMVSQTIPEYARNLAYTLMHKNGNPDQAMDILVQTYRQVPDPLIRVQFQRKIGDLLWRNDVLLGSDSSAFVGGIGSMLDADSSQAASAKDLLIRLVQPETKDAALQEARHLARQFRAYQAAQLGTQR